MRRVFGIAVAALLIGAAPAGASTLVGQWHFDEGFGTVAHDSSGHNNTGTLQGSPLPAWVEGEYGDALRFGGSQTTNAPNSNVHVPDSSSLQPSSGITVAAWVKGTSVGPFRYIVDKGAQGCIAGSYGLYSGQNPNGGGVVFYVSQNNGLTYSMSPDAGAGVWNGQWHFVAGTYDGSAVRMYLDGRQVGTGTAATGPLQYGLPDSNDVTIGDYWTGCPGFFDFPGSIDEPNVWNGALTQSQIQTLMNCPIYGEPSLLTLCLSLRL
jgi:Concanavalin A-like lectin/glucanases superfamily